MGSKQTALIKCVSFLLIDRYNDLHRYPKAQKEIEYFLNELGVLTPNEK